MSLYQKPEHTRDDEKLYQKPEHNERHSLYQKDERPHGKPHSQPAPSREPPKASPLEKPEPKQADAPMEMTNPKAPMALQRK